MGAIADNTRAIRHSAARVRTSRHSAARYWHADNHLFLAAQAMEQDGIGGKEGHKERAALLAAQPLKGLRHLGR